MTKLYLTRHGETLWNTQYRLQGWGDSPLTELGKMQATWLRDRMKDLNIDIIYSSPLIRAFDTAKIIRGNKDIEIKFHDGLKEINVGDLEGLSKEERVNLYEKVNHYYFNLPSKYKPIGNGETFLEVKKRVSKAIDEILNKEKGKTILIVTHGTALKSYLCNIENIDIEDIHKEPFIKQTSLTEIDFLEYKHKIISLACIKHHRI